MAPISDDELDEFYRMIEARTAAAESLGPRRPTTSSDAGRTSRRPCPTPDKDSYPTAWAADQAVERARIVRRTTLPLRIYECVCGRWHITSRPDLRPTEVRPAHRKRRKRR